MTKLVSSVYVSEPLHNVHSSLFPHVAINQGSHDIAENISKSISMNRNIICKSYYHIILPDSIDRSNIESTFSIRQKDVPLISNKNQLTDTHALVTMPGNPMWQIAIIHWVIYLVSSFFIYKYTSYNELIKMISILIKCSHTNSFRLLQVSRTAMLSAFMWV